MKLFVINLARSATRRKRMQERLEALAHNPLFTELGLEWEFFAASDSKDEEFWRYKQKFSAHKCFLWHGRILIDSEIACYASHYRLWQECAERDEPIIVLEDDVCFAPHFLNALQDITRTDFGLVRFYTLDRKRDKYIYQISNSPYHYSLKNTNGTQGYYITPSAARAFLAQECWDSPVDIFMEFVARHGVDNIIYKPFIITEDEATSSASTITNPDGSARTLHAELVGGGAAIPTSWRLLKPLYKNSIQLRRALFKLTYTPPKLTYRA